MGRDTIQLETAISTIFQEYLLEFTFEYGISEDLHPELPGPEDTVVDVPDGNVGVYTKFFEFSDYRIPIPQFLFDILDMDLFNLISASNPTNVKTRVRPRAV
nr:transposase (putative), gypsy type [Tanacetum cinerariifolium]